LLFPLPNILCFLLYGQNLQPCISPIVLQIDFSWKYWTCLKTQHKKCSIKEDVILWKQFYMEKLPYLRYCLGKKGQDQEGYQISLYFVHNHRCFSRAVNFKKTCYSVQDFKKVESFFMWSALPNTQRQGGTRAVLYKGYVNRLTSTDETTRSSLPPAAT